MLAPAFCGTPSIAWEPTFLSSSYVRCPACCRISRRNIIYRNIAASTAEDQYLSHLSEVMTRFEDFFEILRDSWLEMLFFSLYLHTCFLSLTLILLLFSSHLSLIQKLMHMMEYAEKKEKEKPDFCIAWADEGRAFIVRNPDAFAREVVPMFFKATKFSSFTRKLYRWGFRQVNRGTGAMDPIVFANPNLEYLRQGLPTAFA